MRAFTASNKTSMPTLLALFASAIMASGPGLADSDVDLDGTTPHGSTIVNQMDPALIGTWEILQVQIEVNGQGMAFPLQGARISWLDSGSFKEDYSGESNGPRATDIIAGQYIAPSTPSPISTCKIEASGEIIGVVTVNWRDDGTMNTPEMRVTIDRSASTRPEVKCQGSSEVVGNMVSPPLGAGRTVGIGSDLPYVPYYYAIDLDNFTPAGPNGFTDLEIWSVSSNPTRTRYFLRKVE